MAKPSARKQIDSTASFQIQLESEEPFTLWMRSKHTHLVTSPEAYVAATLLPAMKASADLVLDETIDPTFAENLRTIQDIYASWFAGAERIAVTAPTTASPSLPPSNRTATFFSGGVDSFYTLLKHEDAINALVYVHGFDVDFDAMPLRQQVSDMLWGVADHFGKTVIEIETNLRAFSDPRAGWGKYHGAALASIALALRQSIDRIFIPSSFPYSNLKPWGSSPLLDPRWSTEQLEIIHDGCEADRLSKCQRVAESDVALQHLRVCWENRNEAYNCGRCEKCLRTMVQLLAASGLERCTTFEHPLDPALLRKLPTVREKAYRYKPARDALELKGMAPHVVHAIDAALRGPSVFQRAYHHAYKRARSVYHRMYDTLGA